MSEGCFSSCGEARNPTRLAVTALQHGLTLVARDTSAYVKARVPLLNPWEAAA